MMFKKLILAAACVLLLTNVAFAAPAKLIVAHDATWPPMEFINSDKKIVGYSVDYTDAIGKALGIEIEHKNVAWDGIFSGLAAHKYDFIASSVTVTDERKKSMLFTEPYYDVIQAVILPKDSPITNAEGLQGKTLGAQMGTTGYFAIQRIKDSNPKSFDEISLAMESLSNKRLDGVICDDPIAADYVLNQEKYAKDFKIAFTIEGPEKEYYGFAVAKDNPEMVDLLNKGIKKVQEEGTEAALRAKWFGKK